MKNPALEVEGEVKVHPSAILFSSKLLKSCQKRKKLAELEVRGQFDVFAVLPRERRSSDK